VTGLAAVCGWVSGGLAVRDFDTRPAYRDWALRNPRMASRCPTVATPRGAHVFCRFPWPAFIKWADGELRASCRQFVVLPPSKDRFDRPDRHWVGGDPGPSDFPLLDLGQTGFIDPDHPLDGHRKTKPPKPIAPNLLPNDTQTGVRVTQVVLSESVSGLVGVREVVAACMPDGPGERRESLFHLARCLKGLPHVADATADTLEDVVRFWHRIALPVIRTKEWSASWKDFRSAWECVRHPAGRGRALELMTAAAAGELPARAAGFTDEPTRKLLAVCRVLDALGWQGTFFLACRTAERVCGFGSHMTAARRLADFVRAGVLELVEPGSGGTNKRIAASYRLRPDPVAMMGLVGCPDTAAAELANAG
jgi:hypothetical protein